MKKIQILSPDIVICDIKMPVMDGLELASKCKSIYGGLPVFIMLTSYEEFELAHKAIQCQVCDYLVKIDLTPATLISALQKASALAKEYNENKHSTKAINYQDNFFIQLLNNLIDKSLIAQEVSVLAMNLDYTDFVVAYGSMEGPSSANINMDNGHAIFTPTLNMLSEILKKYADIYIIATDTNHFAIIFCFSSTPHAAIKNIINSALNDCIDLIKNYFSVRLSIGVGSTIQSLDTIHMSFSEAKEAYKYAETNSIKIYKALLEERKEFERNKLIFDIQHFIDNHLTDKLTLNMIASSFGISNGYLSSTFKKVIGISLIDYINHQKIEYSKVLLTEQKMKIYEIADSLGFENTYYYSKVFRRYTGCSPSEYISRLIYKD